MATGRLPDPNSAPVTAKGDLYTYSTVPAKLAVGNNGETLVADSSTSTGLRYNPPVGSLANPIINGGFDIWQRGTSGFVPGNNSTTFAADRWLIQRGTTGSTVSRQTISDSTNLPNIQYALRVARDSGNTSTSTIGLATNVETTNSIPFANRTVTLSFYARAGANYSAASSALNAELRTGTGTDENTFSTYTGSATPISSNVTLTTTWQRFALTGTLAATTTEFALKFVFTPVGTAGANDWYEISGVQVDVGTWSASTAPAFRRSGNTLAGELAACQRYYFRNTVDTVYGSVCQGFATSTTGGLLFLNLPVQMRITPSAALEYGNLRCIDSAFTGTLSTLSLTANETSKNVVEIAFSGTTYTQHRPVWLSGNNNAAGYVGVSAEL